MIDVITDRQTGTTARETDPSDSWSRWLRLRPPATTAAAITQAPQEKGTVRPVKSCSG